jgi:hypothetical protein
MKREELLLKDLSARLPYKTLISIDGEKYRMEEIRNALIGIDTYKITIDGCDIECTDIKPYLFPLSSMTEEQMEELKELCDMHTPVDDYELHEYFGISVLYKYVNDDNYKFEFETDVIDWFHKNHIDYRGLIPMGLANDCTNLNIY